MEKRASAKERRHLALLFSQRLGTQVGVKLMFSQSRDEPDEGATENVRIAEDAAKDSDYHTFTTNVAVSYCGSFSVAVQKIKQKPL
ncbi:unnamed protein product [Gongylonema pulchrum]|uniref:Uncharacterized protein n=1 Tax=Gongylonema pulchrum TaxID=637853 RepID=A0A3P6SN80_9BILA|nr:unnamed protein product [Gongylonema pulchrum]